MVGTWRRPLLGKIGPRSKFTPCLESSRTGLSNGVWILEIAPGVWEITGGRPPPPPTECVTRQSPTTDRGLTQVTIQVGRYRVVHKFCNKLKCDYLPMNRRQSDKNCRDCVTNCWVHFALVSQPGARLKSKREKAAGRTANSCHVFRWFFMCTVAHDEKTWQKQRIITIDNTQFTNCRFPSKLFASG